MSKKIKALRKQVADLQERVETLENALGASVKSHKKAAGTRKPARANPSPTPKSSPKRSLRTATAGITRKQKTPAPPPAPANP